jgi:hypothetical protein
MRVETITKELYKFEELSEEAKETARNWWREAELGLGIDHECTFDDAVRMGALLGIEISTYPRNNPKAEKSPVIYFSGFSSEGNGACFEGFYRYAKNAPATIIAETGAGREDASRGDRELLRIARELQAVQKKYFYKLTASMKHRGHYYHSGCMSVDVELSDDRYRDVGTAEDDIKQLMRDFADWIYDQLEAEYDYRMSDEAVDESITANEYEFDINGHIH